MITLHWRFPIYVSVLESDIRSNRSDASLLRESVAALVAELAPIHDAGPADDDGQCRPAVCAREGFFYVFFLDFFWGACSLICDHSPSTTAQTRRLATTTLVATRSRHRGTLSPPVTAGLVRASKHRTTRRPRRPQPAGSAERDSFRSGARATAAAPAVTTSAGRVRHTSWLRQRRRLSPAGPVIGATTAPSTADARACDGELELGDRCITEEVEHVGDRHRPL